MAKADALPPTVGIIADDVDACLSIVGFLSDVNCGQALPPSPASGSTLRLAYQPDSECIQLLRSPGNGPRSNRLRACSAFGAC